MLEDTALINAVLVGDTKRVLTLISAETINAKGEFGKTALHNAVLFKTTPEVIVDALLNNGADFNAYDENGNTPLSEAGKYTKEINDVYARRACKLIEKGALWPDTEGGGFVWQQLPEKIQQFFSEKLQAYQQQQKRLEAEEKTKAFGMLSQYAEHQVNASQGMSTTPSTGLRQRKSNTAIIELKKFCS